MGKINIFLNACLAYESIKIFGAFSEELVHQLSRGNFDVVAAISIIGVTSLLIGSISCNYLYKKFKGE